MPDDANQLLSIVLREALKRGGYLPAREAQQLEDDLANLPPSDIGLESKSSDLGTWERGQHSSPGSKSEDLDSSSVPGVQI